MRKPPKVLKTTQPLSKVSLVITGIAVVGGLILVGWLIKQYFAGGALAAGGAGSPANFQGFADELTGAVEPLIYVLAVAAIVAGGIVYMVSGGESGKVKTAKTIIFAAISGVVLYIFMTWILSWLHNIITDYFSDLTNVTNLTSFKGGDSLFM